MSGEHLLHVLTTTLLCSFSLGLIGCDRDGTGDGPGDGGDAAAAAPFFLPTGDPDNTSAPTVEIDADGGIHAVYSAYAT